MYANYTELKIKYWIMKENSSEYPAIMTASNKFDLTRRVKHTYTFVSGPYKNLEEAEAARKPLLETWNPR